MRKWSTYAALSNIMYTSYVQLINFDVLIHICALVF